MLRHLELLLRWERPHAHTQGGAASWDSGGSEKISPPGLRCCEPSEFRGNAWVCEFQSTQDGGNTCVVSPSGFRSAASSTVFKLWVQEETKLSALKACPCSVTKSFLHIINVIVRHKDTHRTRVKVVEPLVRDTRVAHVLRSRNLLPRTHGAECVFLRRLS